MLVHELARRRAALRVELRQRVLADVELDIDVAQPVLRRPGDGVLEIQAAADVHSYTVEQLHKGVNRDS
ncbi:hypothetical protein D3C83_61600 [compost metagenome]